MKILLIGANGQVGWELRHTLAPLGYAAPTTRAVVRELKPNWVVNAAAYTAVDAAETDVAAATWLNAAVPRILAEEAASCGAWMVHFSTDYVFDGTATRPYDEEDAPNPPEYMDAPKLPATVRCAPRVHSISSSGCRGYTARAGRTFCALCCDWRRSATSFGWSVIRSACPPGAAPLRTRRRR